MAEALDEVMKARRATRVVAASQKLGPLFGES